LGFAQTFVFVAVPALLLARCGIWPSFPDELLRPDGGTANSDARADGDATSDVRTDGGPGDGGPTDAVADVGDAVNPDAPPATWNGFQNCPSPGMGPFTLENAFAPDAGVFNPGNTARDITFDGAGRMIIAARDASTNGTLYSINADGRETVLYSNRSSLISGVRFFRDGELAIAGTFDSNMAPNPANLVPGVSVLNRMGMAQGRFPFVMGLGYPWAVAVNANGSMIVTDFQSNGVVFFADRMVMGAMPVSITMDTGLNNPRSLAFSADYRKLYVASEGSGTITEFDVDATGLPTTVGRRTYAMGLSFPRGMAFDECGNLYVADSAGANGRIARIQARTGVVETLVNFPVPMGVMGSDARSIAFGAGPGFSETTIYVANARERLLQKVEVGVRGQAIPRPNM
jgi:DNA-binding beta-propeller fold protein YncE